MTSSPDAIKQNVQNIYIKKRRLIHHRLRWKAKMAEVVRTQNYLQSKINDRYYPFDTVLYLPT